MTNRRDVLSILGLSTAAAAVSTEAMVKQENSWPVYVPGLPQRGPEYQEMLATAMENLAKSIRNHDAIATNLVTTSQANFDNWLSHEIKITVELPIATRQERIDWNMTGAEKQYEESKLVLERAKIEAENIKKAARSEANRIMTETYEAKAKRTVNSDLV